MTFVFICEWCSWERLSGLQCSHLIQKNILSTFSVKLFMNVGICFGVGGGCICSLPRMDLPFVCGYILVGDLVDRTLSVVSQSRWCIMWAGPSVIPSQGGSACKMEVEIGDELPTWTPGQIPLSPTYPSTCLPKATPTELFRNLLSRLGLLWKALLSLVCFSYSCLPSWFICLNPLTSYLTFILCYILIFEDLCLLCCTVWLWMYQHVQDEDE